MHSKKHKEAALTISEVDMSGKYVTMAQIAELEELENLTPQIDTDSIRIYHRILNRPQLFLAGFTANFDRERIQIFGHTESEYIKTLPDDKRREAFEKLFSYKIPALILCSNIPTPPDLLEIAVENNTPVFHTDKLTAALTISVVTWINEQLAPQITIFGVLVEVYGEGILIVGDTGIGKSETALELIRRGHRLVADDLVEITLSGGDRLVGRAPALTHHFIELRGIGVVDVKSLYGVESVKDSAPIDMLISLEEWKNQTNYDRLGLNQEYENILGVNVVKHTIPIRTGRNLSVIIETAAVNNRQKKMGYNAAEELVNRVSETIRKKNAAKKEKEKADEETENENA